MKRLLIVGFAVLLMTLTAAADENPKVVLETSKGKIVLELNANKAPQTVKNFLAYVDAGFYSNTVFHRVIPNFMIQGGGFTVDMQQKETRAAIRNEAANGLLNQRGTIAMARTPNPHSATAQFFINTKNNDFLNYKGKTSQGWGYAVFGQVVEGMDVVDRISKVQTVTRGRFRDVPAEPIVIKQATRMP
ncbi:MAG: peptidylprolyl isomerase [Desulfobacterales bacterium]|nr:peptidylprolyl isomerase [Desulfobacterales bacterium]